MKPAPVAPLLLFAAMTGCSRGETGIRAGTDRAADFLRAVRSTPFPRTFVEARTEIEACAEDNCPPKPTPGGTPYAP